jgi:Ca2+-binding RTX toxin-like protein
MRICQIAKPTAQLEQLELRFQFSAPESIAGYTLDLQMPSGVFFDAGHYQLTVAPFTSVFDDVYFLDNLDTSRSASSGTYEYQPQGGNSADFNFEDYALGSGIASIRFDTATSGHFIVSGQNQTQDAPFTVLSTTAPVFEFSRDAQGIGDLVVFGTAGDDELSLRVDSAGKLRVNRNGVEKKVDNALVGSVAILAGDGDDIINVGARIMPSTPTTQGNNTGVEVDAAGGNDVVSAGQGDDSVLGGAGKNLLIGNAGNDRLIGSGGHDSLLGGDGDDRLYGRGGDDVLDGGGNVDRLYGGDGADQLFGASSNDRLYGEAGDDQLFGGKGNDLLNGGPGHDRALVEAGDSPTSIDEQLS